MKDDEQATFRIFLDQNEDNDKIFYIDKLEHTIAINGEDKKIPCRRMYGETCPICEQSQAYYKADDEENGKMYYRKKISYVRAMVLEDPLPVEAGQESYLGKMVNLQVNREILSIMKAQMADPDLGDFSDLDDGTNFIIRKTKDGKWSTYIVGTGFARRPSAIPDEYRDNVESIDLSTLLPKDFGLEKVTNMLAAHNTGSDYEDDDHDSGKKTETKTEVKKATPKSVAQVEAEDDAEEEVPVEKVVKAATKPLAQEEEKTEVSSTDFLAELRAKRAAAKAATA